MIADAIRDLAVKRGATASWPRNEMRGSTIIDHEYRFRGRHVLHAGHQFP